MRSTLTRTTVVSLLASATLATGVAAATGASAATQTQDGLVNVAVGDITLQDINIGVAAQVVAQVCGVKVGPVAVLGTAIDAGAATRTVCTSPTGPVTVSQN